MDVITPGERDQLKKRLEALIANRAVISERIAEARALGDLKENAEYHAAREQQGMEEAEIKRLEERLASASVVDESKQADGVVFLGSTVKLVEEDEDDDEFELYRLVGESSGEVDIDADVVEVTATSPMGEALMKSGSARRSASTRPAASSDSRSSRSSEPAHRGRNPDPRFPYDRCQSRAGGAVRPETMRTDPQGGSRWPPRCTPVPGTRCWSRSRS